MTIFALSSGRGKAALAVLRVSGPDAGEAYRALAARPLPPARRATLTRLREPRSGEILDEGVVLWFPAPHSYTGEDLLELQVHGGVAVVEAVLAALGRIPGLRPAEAGEFTRRAFQNGRLDLTRAEGVADLVEAETEAQRRQAQRQSEGVLAVLYDGWREDLLGVLAHVEAVIDFPDEDLPPDLMADTSHKIQGLLDSITLHLDDKRRGERLREGFYVAIVGAPNVGKSSLLNWLARRDAAIVSATAGTTRDVIEVHLDLDGYPVIVADTAGLRESADAVEDEGVRRALERAARADLKLALFDATLWPEKDRATADLVDGDSLVVVNKVDLAPANGAEHPVSVTEGTGLAGLLEALTAAVGGGLERSGAPALTRARHRQALETCTDALRRALEATAPELAGEDLRLAGRALGRITGRVDVEDILDVVFRDFCIGK